MAERDEWLAVRRVKFKDEVLSLAARHADEVCGRLEKKTDDRHEENRARLQAIDHNVRGVQQTLGDMVAVQLVAKDKMDGLYGNGTGRPGAIERITAKLESVSRWMYLVTGAGMLAMAVIGWYIAWSKH